MKPGRILPFSPAALLLAAVLCLLFLPEVFLEPAYFGNRDRCRMSAEQAYSYANLISQYRADGDLPFSCAPMLQGDWSRDAFSQHSPNQQTCALLADLAGDGNPYLLLFLMDTEHVHSVYIFGWHGGTVHCIVEYPGSEQSLTQSQMLPLGKGYQLILSTRWGQYVDLVFCQFIDGTATFRSWTVSEQFVPGAPDGEEWEYSVTLPDGTSNRYTPDAYFTLLEQMGVLPGSDVSRPMVSSAMHLAQMHCALLQTATAIDRS